MNNHYRFRVVKYILPLFILLFFGSCQTDLFDRFSEALSQDEYAIAEELSSAYIKEDNQKAGDICNYLIKDSENRMISGDYENSRQGYNLALKIANNFDLIEVELWIRMGVIRLFIHTETKDTDDSDQFVKDSIAILETVLYPKVHFNLTWAISDYLLTIGESHKSASLLIYMAHELNKLEEPMFFIAYETYNRMYSIYKLVSTKEEACNVAETMLKYFIRNESYIDSDSVYYYFLMLYEMMNISCLSKVKEYIEPLDNFEVIHEVDVKARLMLLKADYSNFLNSNDTIAKYSNAFTFNEDAKIRNPELLYGYLKFFTFLERNNKEKLIADFYPDFEIILNNVEYDEKEDIIQKSLKYKEYVD